MATKVLPSRVPLNAERGKRGGKMGGVYGVSAPVALENGFVSQVLFSASDTVWHLGAEAEDFG